LLRPNFRVDTCRHRRAQSFRNIKRSVLDRRHVEIAERHIGHCGQRRTTQELLRASSFEREDRLKLLRVTRDDETVTRTISVQIRN